MSSNNALYLLQLESIGILRKNEFGNIQFGATDGYESQVIIFFSEKLYYRLRACGFNVEKTGSYEKIKVAIYASLSENYISKKQSILDKNSKMIKNKILKYLTYDEMGNFNNTFFFMDENREPTEDEEERYRKNLEECFDKFIEDTDIVNILEEMTSKYVDLSHTTDSESLGKDSCSVAMSIKDKIDGLYGANAFSENNEDINNILDKCKNGEGLTEEEERLIVVESAKVVYNKASYQPAAHFFGDADNIIEAMLIDIPNSVSKALNELELSEEDLKKILWLIFTPEGRTLIYLSFLGGTAVAGTKMSVPTHFKFLVSIVTAAFFVKIESSFFEAAECISKKFEEMISKDQILIRYMIQLSVCYVIGTDVDESFEINVLYDKLRPGDPETPYILKKAISDHLWTSYFTKGGVYSGCEETIGLRLMKYIMGSLMEKPDFLK